MIVDPSDIVGRNRRQENSNAMLSEGEEVNMGMVVVSIPIHVEPVFLNCKKQKKQKNRASSRQTRTHDGSGTVHLQNLCCVCTRCMVTNSFICIVHPILEVYLWYTYIHNLLYSYCANTFLFLLNFTFVTFLH